MSGLVVARWGGDRWKILWVVTGVVGIGGTGSGLLTGGVGIGGRVGGRGMGCGPEMGGGPVGSISARVRVY